MNVSPSSQETSKNPFSNSLASGEVMDRMQGALPGSSNNKPNIDTEMKIDKPGSVATDGANTTIKIIKESTKSERASSTDDLKKLAIAAVAEKETDHSLSADANADAEGAGIINDVKGESESDGTVSAQNIGAIFTDAAAVADATQKTYGDGKGSNTDGDVTEKTTEEVKASEPKKKPRKRWKKPADKPPRPLSAYNLFFKRERGIMIGAAAEKTDQEQGKKRVHRKTHGKIGFAEMARIIGGKWKKLPEEEKEEFTVVAKQEKEKYAELLANWREEKKKQSIASSIGAGEKGKKGSGKELDDDTDSLLQSINEDREQLLKRHSAFRMQMKMYEEMTLNRLAREGRPMPALDYMRNMPDDRSYFGGRMTQYPNAAEDSGRNILQHMLSLSGHDGPGQVPRMMDGPMGSSMGNTMGTMGSTMGGSMGNSMAMNNNMGNQMSNPMGNSMGNSRSSSMGHQMGHHPLGHPMGHQMGHQMGHPMANSMGPMANNMNGPMGNTMNNSMGNNSMSNTMNTPMGNTMGGGMVPVNNSAPSMSSSSHQSQYEMERYQHMRMHGHGHSHGYSHGHGQYMGTNSNHMSPGRNSPPLARNSGPRGPPDMDRQEGTRNETMDGAMIRRYPPQNRFHHDGNM